MKLLDDLQKDIEALSGDVSDLMWHRKIYTDLAEIVASNPKINVPNAFHDFVKTSYVSSIVLGVCRQIDRDAQALSLINILQKIFDNAETITKDWFAAHYRNSALGESFGRKDFEERFGKLNFIDPSIVHGDIGNLIFHTKEIKKYRNKRIAHYQKGNVTFDKNFNFSTINEAIDIIEGLYQKYHLLLHQKNMVTLLPIDLSGDYTEIFREPWVKG